MRKALKRDIGRTTDKGKLLAIVTGNKPYVVEIEPGVVRQYAHCHVEQPAWPSDAPEWAKWMAMDDGGAWYYYDTYPQLNFMHGLWRTDGKFDICTNKPTFSGNWKDSLIAKPC